MRKIRYDLDIGYPGCNDEGVMEVEDNMTDAEIDDMVNDMAAEHGNSWEGDERLGWWSDMTEEEREEENEYFRENVCGSWQFTTEDDDA